MGNTLNIGDKIALEIENAEKTETYFVYSIEPDIHLIPIEIGENKETFEIGTHQQVKLLNKEGFGIKIPLAQFKRGDMPIKIKELNNKNQIYNYQVIEE